MKNNLKKKKKQIKAYTKLSQFTAGLCWPRINNTDADTKDKSTLTAQRYEYAMLTTSACSMPITFFLLVNFWKIEVFQPKRKFLSVTSMLVFICLLC